MRRLIDEHRCLAALIGELERGAAAREPLEPGAIPLLHDIVAYVHDYTDGVHHPTEDQLFARLLRRRRQHRGLVTRLQRDHARLAAETGDLLTRLAALVARPRADRVDAALRACRRYAQHQRQHMQFENQQLFPLAMAQLRAADWRQIAERFIVTEDPLFGRIVAPRHRVLYEYLLDPGASADRRPAVARWLEPQRHQRALSIVIEGGRAWFARLLRPGDSWIQCGNDLFDIGLRTTQDALATYGLLTARAQTAPPAD